MNDSLRKTVHYEEDQIGSIYDTLGWNEKSFMEEDLITHHRNSLISHKTKYVQVEEFTVPNFILNQISSFEKCTCCFHFFCCHLCTKTGYKLEDIEQWHLQIYNSFKLKASEVYSTKDSSHENSLRFLYVQTLASDLTPNLINKKWKTIGFTVEDPRTDIKIGGYFALLFINHFIMSNEEEFELIQKTGKSFFFAMCAIIITLFLRLALDAFNSETIAEHMRKENNIEPVNVFQFINFCRRYNDNSKYPFEIMTNILLSAKDEIILNKSCTLSGQILLIKNHFNRIFYDELSCPMDTRTEASFQSVV
ncbi:MAG: ELMO domain-containing protein [archaeon]|nr:ELMO domain-containing protein [archaeon]